MNNNNNNNTVSIQDCNYRVLFFDTRCFQYFPFFIPLYRFSLIKIKFLSPSYDYKLYKLCSTDRIFGKHHCLYSNFISPSTHQLQVIFHTINSQ